MVLGFGGFASFPGALMAVARNVPLVVHNLDARPGLANRVLRHGADRVLTGFPGVLGEGRDRRVEWVGNPLREAIEAAAPPEQRFAGRAGPLKVLVVGGSQGALALNEAVPQALALMPRDPVRSSRTRPASATSTRCAMPTRAPASPPSACRSSTTSRAAMPKRTSSSAAVARRRSRNSRPWASRACSCRSRTRRTTTRSTTRGYSRAHGAAEMWLQRDLTPARLAEWLGAQDRGRLLRMAVAARALRKTGATRRVAELCLELADAMKHKVKRVHFVGIGGAGMSGIAEVLANQGYQVSGSDLAASPVTRRLAGMGVRIAIGHVAGNVAGADAVVVSTAVPADNPEVVAAREQGIPVVPRALMLAELMRLKQGIAVAGTHGKTTTTSLIASVLAEGGLDPTFVIGGRLLAADANARLGRGDFLVAEADESDASFLYLSPVIAVVTNIDADHMETYGHDFARLTRAFVDFVQRLPFYGVAVLCIDDPNVREIRADIAKPVVTYGLAADAELRAVDVVNAGGRMRFVARANDAPDLAVDLAAAGVHNVQNALAAIAIGREVGVPDAAIAAALAGFKGVGRRFQRHGEVALEGGGAFTLIDDYGHHPAEMVATLAAARESFPGRRLVLAFQPHRFSRTRDLFEDFVRVLSTVDALVLSEVYPAGEAPIVAADGRALARAVRVAGKVEPVFVETIAEMPAAIRALARDGDVVLTMGAGSVGGVPALLTAGN